MKEVYADWPLLESTERCSGACPADFGTYYERSQDPNDGREMIQFVARCLECGKIIDTLAYYLDCNCCRCEHSSGCDAVWDRPREEVKVMAKMNDAKTGKRQEKKTASSSPQVKKVRPAHSRPDKSSLAQASSVSTLTPSTSSSRPPMEIPIYRFGVELLFFLMFLNVLFDAWEGMAGGPFSDCLKAAGKFNFTFFNGGEVEEYL